MQVTADYTDVSGLLLSCVCMGYELNCAETRMNLDRALNKTERSSVNASMPPAEKLERIDQEVCHYISSLEALVKVTTILH